MRIYLISCINRRNSICHKTYRSTMSAYLFNLLILCQRFQIARHCERTPAQSELHPKSPYYDESNFAPFGYGQLTNVSCYWVRAFNSLKVSNEKLSGTIIEKIDIKQK